MLPVDGLGTTAVFNPDNGLFFCEDGYRSFAPRKNL
jgi:hypothetical protein